MNRKGLMHISNYVIYLCHTIKQKTPCTHYNTGNLFITIQKNTHKMHYRDKIRTFRFIPIQRPVRCITGAVFSYSICQKCTVSGIKEQILTAVSTV